MPGPRKFDEAAAEEIIRRAIDIQRTRDDYVTEADLKSIALDLGISSGIVDEAIAGVDGRSGHSSLERAPHGAVVWPICAAVIGLLLGIVTSGGQQNDGLGLMVAGATVLASISLAKGRARHRRFQISNFGLWGTFILHSILLHPYWTEDILPIGIAILAATGVVGGLIVERQHQRKNSDGGPIDSQHTHASNGIFGTLRRVWRRLEAWVVMSLHRSANVARQVTLGGPLVHREEWVGVQQHGRSGADVP